MYMDNIEISLEQYLVEEQIRLDRFATWWHIQHLQNSTAFPEKMWSGDWDEQSHLLK